VTCEEMSCGELDLNERKGRSDAKVSQRGIVIYDVSHECHDFPRPTPC
jgi:hypothetical protein